MKVGIDISQVVYEGTGVARFTKGLCEAILQYNTSHDWTFFFSSFRQNIPNDLKKKINKRGYKLITSKLPPTILSFIWNTLHILPIEHFTGPLDWFITSDWTEPPAQAKKATIAHDLVYLHYPETLHKTILETQTKRFQWIKKESCIIFADSKSTQNDLIKLCNIDKNKVRVIYPGVEVKNENTQKEKKSFILTVGKIEPRKNLKRLIEAFQSLNDKNIELWIAGPPGWSDINVKSKNIKFLGYVSDRELSELYRTCLFFVYPSLWEGFGYPVIEAMAHGAPVATSNVSSLKEIAEGSALLFDPNKTESIRAALKTLIENNNLRQELSAKGLKKSKLFTWKNYYNEMIKALQSY